jgi:hypothetical protein
VQHRLWVSFAAQWLAACLSKNPLDTLTLGLAPSCCLVSCRGAAQGEGLGNAFLSHISAVDGIYHVCRAFEDPDVTHVEDRVDPVQVCGGGKRHTARDGPLQQLPVSQPYNQTDRLTPAVQASLLQCPVVSGK